MSELEEFLKKNLIDIEKKLVVLEEQVNVQIKILTSNDPTFRDLQAQLIVLGKEAMKIKLTLKGENIPDMFLQSPPENNKAISRKLKN